MLYALSNTDRPMNEPTDQARRTAFGRLYHANCDDELLVTMFVASPLDCAKRLRQRSPISVFRPTFPDRSLDGH